jgi:hypothetical protein
MLICLWLLMRGKWETGSHLAVRTSVVRIRVAHDVEWFRDDFTLDAA